MEGNTSARQFMTTAIKISDEIWLPALREIRLHQDILTWAKLAEMPKMYNMEP